jgi:flagellar export protein FliJ
MKPRNTLICLKKFQLTEKIRKVAQIEAMIADFRRIANDLELEIAAEEVRAGIHDPAHFAYPTYAKAAITRRDNLKRSADELALQLEGTKATLQESFEELKKAELLDERDQDRHAAGEAHEPADLDTIGNFRTRSAIA